MWPVASLLECQCLGSNNVSNVGLTQSQFTHSCSVCSVCQCLRPWSISRETAAAWTAHVRHHGLRVSVDTLPASHWPVLLTLSSDWLQSLALSPLCSVGPRRTFRHCPGPDPDSGRQRRSWGLGVQKSFELIGLLSLKLGLLNNAIVSIIIKKGTCHG